MRTSHRKPLVRPLHRTALAAALTLAFGSAANAGNINVGPRGLVAGPYTLWQAITDENTKYSSTGADCSSDTLVIASGFVTADSRPLPAITCPGLTIRGSGAYPNASIVSGANVDYTYGGPYCGIEADVPVTIQNLDISGFTYGAGLCGEFNSISGSGIHGNVGGISTSIGTRPNIGGSGRNYVFGNTAGGFGVSIAYGGAADIIGNYIGTPDGTTAAPNGNGVIAGGANVNVNSNVITETGTAVVMGGSGSVSGNFIGVDATGSRNLGAGNTGISLNTPDPGVSITGNTVANMGFGIEVLGVSGGQVSGNRVGLTSNGQPLANSGAQSGGINVFCSSGVQVTSNQVSGQQSWGVLLADSSSSTVDRNSITRNPGDGITVSTGCGIGRLPLDAAAKRTGGSPIVALQTATSGLTVSNNAITNNGGYGVDFVYGGMSSNDLVHNNTIANNARSGVAVLDPASTGIAIIGNAIYGNAVKNIELTPGANEGIGPPAIQTVLQNGTNTIVTYQLNNPSATPHDYTVEFFTNPSAAAPAATVFQAQAYQPGVTGVQTFTQTFSGSLDNFSLTSTLSAAPGAWVETSELSSVGVATLVLPPVTFSPVLTDFGTLYVNQTSNIRIIIASNGTANPVAVSAPTVTPPFIIRSTDCTGSIAPHSSCSINVVFAPSASGVAHGTVALGAFTAQLTGTALDAPILDMPSLVDFGTYILGAPAITRTATITDTGSAVVTIDDISVSGPFGLSHDCPIDLKPGDSCTLTLTFSSSTLGTAAGAVTIRSNALGGARTIALGALVQAKPEPVIEIHPQSLTFGNGVIGAASASLRLIISNSGGIAAALGTMTPSLDYVVVGTTCTATLAPQASCTTDVAMRPIGFGSRPGSLTFTSNAEDSPHTVGLGGTGCRPPDEATNRGTSTDLCSP